MYITKPLGCVFQLIGTIFLIIGIVKIANGTDSGLLSGFFVLLIGVILIWRGGRRAERKAELNRH